MNDAERVLTTGEAARWLGVRSPNTIKAWVRDGLLVGYRRGGRVLVSEASVRQMVHDSRVVTRRRLDARIGAALADLAALGDAGDAC